MGAFFIVKTKCYTAAMPRVSKMEEQIRVQRMHRIIDEHAPVVPDLRFWLIHVLHWHVAVVAAIAVTFVVLSFASGNSVDASGF